MAVKAPFHVGADFQGDWLLFAFRAELATIDEVMWDYFKCQRLQTQSELLSIRSQFEKWKMRRKFARRSRSELLALCETL